MEEKYLELIDPSISKPVLMLVGGKVTLNIDTDGFYHVLDHQECVCCNDEPIIHYSDGHKMAWLVAEFLPESQYIYD